MHQDTEFRLVKCDIGQLFIPPQTTEPGTDITHFCELFLEHTNHNPRMFAG
jgi:hypothetical protein